MDYDGSWGFVLQFMDTSVNFSKLTPYSLELLIISTLKFIRQFNTYQAKFF